MNISDTVDQPLKRTNSAAIQSASQEASRFKKVRAFKAGRAGGTAFPAEEEEAKVELSGGTRDLEWATRTDLSRKARWACRHSLRNKILMQAMTSFCGFHGKKCYRARSTAHGHALHGHRIQR
jgi:hypothetical protein